jgi:hypothetical protein
VRPSGGAAKRLGYNAAVMRATVVMSMVGIGIIVSSCATDEREWMKVDQKYTTAEFRRDLAECTAKGKLDEECMRARGWVTVAPPKSEPKKDDPLSQPYGRSGPRR